MTDKKEDLSWGRTLILLFFFQMAVFTTAFPEERQVEPWDSDSPVEYREPPADVIETYRNDKNFDYDRNQQKISLLGRILQKIASWLVQGLAQQSWILYLFGGLGIILLLLLILRILDIPISGLFSFSRTSAVSPLDMVHPAEGMSQQELDKLFQMYRSNGAYREAVRVLYLIYLKTLHQRGIIRLKMNKTNRDYGREIKDELGQQSFRQLSKLYNYVWYGQFNVSHHEFYAIEREFVKVGLPGISKSEANG